MNVILCDDDNDFIREEKACIVGVMNRLWPDIVVEVDQCNTGDELIQKCSKNKYDIIFLDIEIKEENGFEIARILYDMGIERKVVFVSSHDNLVYNSFVCHPVGFVRKAYLEDEVESIIDIVMQDMLKDTRLIEIKGAKVTQVVSLDETVKVESYRHNLIFTMFTKSIEVRGTIGNYEKQLSENGFVNADRGCMVNLRYVKALNKDNLELQNGLMVHVTRKRLKEVREQLTEYRGRNRWLGI
ncbi:MAG: LytTR family DNA-binding domain-containing protein [Lachnospira sp.]|nr:LytTR family DNA-binding domain-containing protein [Lachnospira sp.]